jgi:branched-subunit amino acid transport protein
MSASLQDIGPYLALVLVGFLPNEIWRWLGIVLARGIDEGSEVLTWVRAVATAVLAGVVAQLIFAPPGALASVPLLVRVAAIAAGYLAYRVGRRSIFVGVIGGEVALVLGDLLWQWAMR